MSRYDWDPKKAESNARKHGVTFYEAESTASHPFAIEELDVGHSALETRLKVIGWSPMDRVVVVIVSVDGPRPRIISARRATKRERHAYEARS